MATTIEQVQQVFADNFPIKSTVVMFSDSDNPWDSSQNKIMTFRTIAVHETSQKKWILYTGTDAAVEANWSSLTSDAASNITGASGITVDTSSNISLGGPLTENTLLDAGTNGVNFEISKVGDFKITDATAITIASGELGIDDATSITQNVGKITLLAVDTALENTAALDIESVDNSSEISLRIENPTTNDLTKFETYVDDTDSANSHITMSANFTGTVSQELKFDETSMLVTSDTGGLTYATDYSGYWGTSGVNPRWIPDAGYVDNAIATGATLDASNGLTITPNESGPDAIKLGGALTGATTITGAAQTFAIAGTSTTSIGSTGTTTVSSGTSSVTLDGSGSTATLAGDTTATVSSASGNVAVTAATTVSIDATTTNTISSGTATLTLNNTGTGHTFADTDSKGLSYAANYAVANASNPQWIPDKAYVDAVATGLEVKNPVIVVAVTEVTQIGGGTTTIDGVGVVVGDRVLLAGQGGDAATAHADNGIYVVVSGAPWTRASDANDNGELNGGSYVFVDQGTTYSDTGWVLTTDGEINIGTDPQTWALFNRAGYIQGGDGIDVTGNTVKVDLSGTPGLEFASNKLQVKHAVATSSGLSTDATGLALQLNNYNAGADVNIKTSSADILFTDDSVVNLQSGIGITKPTSTNVPATAQNAVGLYTQDITSGSERLSNVTMNRSTGDISIRRNDIADGNGKYLELVDGGIALGVETLAGAATRSKLELSGTGSATLTATTSLAINYTGPAIITDNRVGAAAKGLEYAAQYTWNDTSLITKKFVDDAILGVTLNDGSGTTYNGTNKSIDLGGTLSANASIAGAASYSFGVNDASTISLDSAGATTINASTLAITSDTSTISITATTDLNLTATNTAKIYNTTSTLDLNTSGVNTFTDTGLKGLVYSADYSDVGKIDDRWIPDYGAVKTYVTNNATVGVTNGLTKTTAVGEDTIELGGTLTKTTSILGATQNLSLGTAASVLTTASVHATTTNIVGSVITNNLTLASAAGTLVANVDTSITLSTNSGNKFVINNVSPSVYTDQLPAASALGIQYAADYTALGDLSLVHKAHVNREVSTINTRIDNLTGADIAYDNSQSGTAGGGIILADNVQDAIDELSVDLYNIPTDQGISNVDGVITLGGRFDENVFINGADSAQFYMALGDGDSPSISANSSYFNAEYNLIRHQVSNDDDISSIAINPDSVELSSSVYPNSNPNELTLGSAGSGIKINAGVFTFTDGRAGALKTGIEYAADYKATYSDRSLVDKAYVTSAVGAVSLSNGSGTTYVTGTPGKVDLGGAVTGDVSITASAIDNRSYSLSGFATISSTATNGTASSTFNSSAGTASIKSNNAVGAGSSSSEISVNSTALTLKYGLYQDEAQLAFSAALGGVFTASSNGLGLFYTGDYSTASKSNENWIPDLKHVKSLTRTAGNGLSDSGVALNVGAGSGISVDTTTVAVNVAGSQPTSVIDLGIDGSDNVALDKYELITGTNNLSNSTSALTIYLANDAVDLGIAKADVVADLSTGSAVGTLAELVDNGTNLGVDKAGLRPVLTAATTTGDLITLNDDGTDLGIDKDDIRYSLSSGTATTTFLQLVDDGTELGVQKSGLVTTLTTAAVTGTLIPVVDNGTNLGVDSAAIITELDVLADVLTQGSVWVGDASDNTTEVDISQDGNLLIGNGTTAIAVAMSGDATIINSGALTIVDGAITSAKILDGTIADGDLNKTNIPLSGFGAANTTVDMGSNRLINLSASINQTDAVTKAELEAVAAGLSAKDAAKYVTATAIGIANFADKTLVAAALDDVDGIPVAEGDIVEGDRILLISEGGDFTAAHVDNGIYVWHDVAGTNGSSGLVRSEDFDGNPTGEVSSGSFVFVVNGDALGHVNWMLNEPAGIADIGIDPLKFTTIGGTSEQSAGAGLYKLANVFHSSLNATGGLEFDLPEVAAGVPDVNSAIKVKPDTLGGINLAAAISTSANGVAIKVDDTTIEEGTSGRLQVKTAGIDTDQLAADSVTDLKIDLGESTNQVNATTFIVTSAFTSDTGLIDPGTDTIQDALEALDAGLHLADHEKPTSGSGITVTEPAGTNGVGDTTVNWTGALSEDTVITGATASQSVYLGGTTGASNVDRIESFNVHTGSTTLGANLTMSADSTFTYDAFGATNSTFKLTGTGKFVVTVDDTTQLSVGDETKLTGQSGSSLELDESGSNTNIFTDGNTTAAGLQYAADYSDDYTTRSLVDKEFVTSYVGNFISIPEIDEFNPYIDVASTSGLDTLILIGPGVPYVFAYDVRSITGVWVNGIAEQRGVAWDIVDPDNSNAIISEGNEEAGHAVQWYNDVYYLESDDVVRIGYARASNVAGTNGI